MTRILAALAIFAFGLYLGFCAFAVDRHCFASVDGDAPGFVCVLYVRLAMQP